MLQFLRNKETNEENYICKGFSFNYSVKKHVHFQMYYKRKYYIIIRKIIVQEERRNELNYIYTAYNVHG